MTSGNDKISVIIPVYNVEKYFDKCIQSILNQTYKNLEIILVDDGSTDNSGKMCDEYAQKDDRIKVMHVKNGGVSVARNIGIDNTTGNYVGFIDADDFVDLDFYEVLYNNIVKENADLSMCGVYMCFKDTDLETLKSNTIVEYHVFNTEEAIRNVLECKNNGFGIYNKLYKKELFSEIRYPVGQKIAEDAFVLVDILMKCKKVVFTTEKKYYYIRRSNSATTKKFGKENYDLILTHERNKKIIEENYPSLTDLAQFRVCYACFHLLDKMIISAYPIDMEIVKKLRKNFIFILKNDTFAITRKTAMCLLMINVNLYKFVCKKFYKKNRQIIE